MKLFQITLIIATGILMALIDVAPYLNRYKKDNKESEDK